MEVVTTGKSFINQEGVVMSISKMEVLPIIATLIDEVYAALQDDEKITLDEWIKIATQVGQEAFEQYSDDDDVWAINSGQSGE